MARKKPSERITPDPRDSISSSLSLNGVDNLFECVDSCLQLGILRRAFFQGLHRNHQNAFRSPELIVVGVPIVPTPSWPNAAKNSCATGP